MTEVWVLVVVVGVLTIALKAAGPVVLGSKLVPLRLLWMLELVGPSILAALVVTQTFGSSGRLVVDARSLGVIAAAITISVRAPILSTVIVAAATTALARILL